MRRLLESDQGFLAMKIIACIIFSVVLGMLMLTGRSAHPLKLSDVPLDERERYWQERIRAVGGAAAYEEIARAMDDMTSPQKHFNTHVFGTALFDTEAMDGVTACDGRFNYGCFHAFMIRAIEVRGAEAAQELHEACIRALGATAEQCEHGIGHGLLGTIGYGLSDIAEALSVCESLTPPTHPVGGCIGGVFMEYGLRGMQGAGSSTPRAFVESEALEPCTHISGAARQTACAFWQPMWWMEAHPERDDGAFMANEMGSWCRQLPGDERVIPTCVAGIANRMELLTDGDPTRTGSMCRLITDAPRLQEYCHMKSAMQFMRYHPLDFSLRACEDLPPDSSERCRADATRESAARRADQVPVASQAP